ncbi:hypothetical protein [Amycolatopsis thermophila]|uniref:Uncharacterized protein n=1 Tax=Amycolatopsis thermophila TaxID=206084 RepID=A0ABU0F4L1_9PSEU|nr:hypothetical protein [Amycolatopsis thermophila]MDQ0382438.1 hypothetical protein [Amycolatopsis thermophila]
MTRQIEVPIGQWAFAATSERLAILCHQAAVSGITGTDPEQFTAAARHLATQPLDAPGILLIPSRLHDFLLGVIAGLGYTTVVHQAGPGTPIDAPMFVKPLSEGV